MISYLKGVEEDEMAGGLVWTQGDVGGEGRGIVLTGGEGVGWVPRSF